VPYQDDQALEIFSGVSRLFLVLIPLQYTFLALYRDLPVLVEFRVFDDAHLPVLSLEELSILATSAWSAPSSFLRISNTR
jgi:hypothetical protein